MRDLVERLRQDADPHAAGEIALGVLALGSLDATAGRVRHHAPVQLQGVQQHLQGAVEVAHLLQRLGQGLDQGFGSLKIGSF